MKLWTLDPQWIPRLQAAGLLPLVYLVEAHGRGEGQDESKRFPFDRSLLAALVDRWKREGHTFHLPIGEITITLWDVVELSGKAN
ncbi:hypothetical protein E2562_021389 [Oryza meyeriana var. granulata]|uniref:Aminotransferase-like plant mobile domain-containing protein n=1 Tax=Oryza meyeriana var. granulata TaxID=110450 RepID=A0A6G1EXN2_9ORYZ|nr:hypothetical protein E2562_021389 [Oryza meyeriana var. granulata]